MSEPADFWGSERTLHLHHPMFIYQFADTAYAIKEGSRVIAYLFGFFAQPPTSTSSACAPPRRPQVVV